MKNIIITGSSGMIGNLILDLCLNHTKVGKITTINRCKSGIDHPKLNEIIHHDFLNFSTIDNHLKNLDVCFYCIGVYTGKVSREDFKKITVDYTRSFADALRKNNEHLSFCFLSGAGADSSEKSRLMFAKDKGMAENYLISKQFESLYIFRPGYIYPVIKRKEPNFSYKITRALYKPVISKFFPKMAITSEELANVMVKIGIEGSNKTIYENKDIRKNR